MEYRDIVLLECLGIKLFNKIGISILRLSNFASRAEKGHTFSKCFIIP